MGDRIDKGKRFEEKVAKLINEELRRNPEDCVTEAWLHLHTKNASKDPYWGMPKEEEQNENKGD